MNITVLLLGITGDLAKRKIIPAIAQFSKQSSHQINLIGYSRSVADGEDIQRIIDEHDGKVNLSFVQGSYDDTSKFEKIIEATTQGDDRLIAYLAVPPKVIAPFIKNVCPLRPHNIDVVIEKPFGENLEQAKEIIAAAKGCVLTDCIFFFDHYKFKSSTFLSKTQSEELVNFAGVRPYKITVHALESLGVSGRAGYYDSVGALKDMWQHLQSMVEIYKETFGIKLDWNTFKVNRKILGQYETYRSEVNDKSNTDSFFHVEGDLDGIHVEFESGKQIGFKDTAIKVEFDDNATINWNLDPVKYVEVTSGIRKLNEIMLEENKILDHARLLTNLIDKDYSRFISYEDVLTTWQTYNKVADFKNESELLIYKNGTNPLAQ